MMSLDLQYRNAHWLIIKNIKNYICPRKSRIPSERYKKHSYIPVCNNPKIINPGWRLMCLNSSGLWSNDNINFDSSSVNVFLDTCMTAAATPLKNVFLPNTCVPTIENMEGSGGKLTIYGYGSIAYHVQTDDVSNVTIKVKNRPYVPNSIFFPSHPDRSPQTKITTGDMSTNKPTWSSILIHQYCSLTSKQKQKQ